MSLVCSEYSILWKRENKTGGQKLENQMSRPETRHIRNLKKKRKKKKESGTYWVNTLSGHLKRLKTNICSYQEMIKSASVTSPPRFRWVFRAFGHRDRNLAQNMADGPRFSLMTSSVTAEAECQNVMLTEMEMLKHDPKHNWYTNFKLKVM